MTNSTSTDVIFIGARCDTMVAKYYSCPSTAPAGREINESGALNLPPV